MRTTVDIPDPIYRELKMETAAQGTSVKEFILSRVKTPKQAQLRVDGRKGRFPAVKSKNPGSLKLGPEGVYEYIPFP